MNDNFYLALRQENKNSKFYYQNGLDIELPKYMKNFLDSRYHKVSRIKERFIYMICRRKYYYFITFTFDDEIIKKCDRTKKDLIKNCLNGIDDILYILNVDYGDTTDREHYHCLFATDYKINKTYFDLTYPCYTWIENIHFSEHSISKVTKYIDKISNHACKDSTGYNRVYYNFKGYNSLHDKDTRKFIKMIDINRVYK